MTNLLHTPQNKNGKYVYTVNLGGKDYPVDKLTTLKDWFQDGRILSVTSVFDHKQEVWTTVADVLNTVSSDSVVDQTKDSTPATSECETITSVDINKRNNPTHIPVRQGEKHFYTIVVDSREFPVDNFTTLNKWLDEKRIHPEMDIFDHNNQVWTTVENILIPPTSENGSNKNTKGAFSGNNTGSKEQKIKQPQYENKYNITNLMKCPSCGWGIYKEAQACPKCGYPLAKKIEESIRQKQIEEYQKKIRKENREKEEIRNGNIGCFVVVLILFAFFYFIGTSDEKTNTRSSSTYNSNTSSLVYSNSDTNNKFGLTVDQRKAVYYQFTDKIQDAVIKADQKYPNNSERGAAYIAYEDQQEQIIMEYLAKINKLTVEQMDQIMFEGTENNWPQAPSRIK